MDMSMGTSVDSMSMLPTSTMSGMLMASSSGSSMSMSSESMMGMDTMAMTFFTGSATPLYSMNFVPTTLGQYAGMCILLIVLSIILRALLALRVNVSPLFNAAEIRHNGGMVYEAYRHGKSTRYPWRAKEAVVIGLIDVAIAGLAYLLMIAVMTMNVGYFMSVLAGVFTGSVIFSRFMPNAAAH